LLETSGFLAGRDFLLAYSPERIDPGNEKYSFHAIPRVVGGLTPEATGVATLFYAQLVGDVVSVSSPRAAELAKLLENTFRHVNIALVNEMAMLCHEIGIDVWEVINAAASKPFGFMPFYPGPGVGGHCIPLDPTYLAWLVRRDVGQQFRMVEQAQDINAQMPRHVADRIGEALNDMGRPLKGAAVLVLGVSYKPDVGDSRESPAAKVIAQLRRRGAKVTFYDPYIDRLHVNGDVLEAVTVGPRVLSEAHCVALLTPHRLFDLEWIAKHARLVFDSQNAYGSARYPNVVRL
jgi:UDP-N-acetyl-D-glucosamine dehydrogenase